MTKPYRLGDHEIPLSWEPHVFEPNLTTRKLASHIAIPTGATCLDLGCGVGPLSIFAAMEGASSVVGVELQPEACDLARVNVQSLGFNDRVEIRCGHLYDPIGDRQFDVIINDVAGIAAPVAALSPWYPDTVKQAGDDGTNLTIEVIQRARTHLLPNGVLYFPLLSLAAEHKVRAVIEECFSGQVTVHAKHRVPFPPQLVSAMTLMNKLKESSVISFDQIGSRYFWYLTICSVRNTG